ncbi:fungal-specific transcription factor domain-containing protein [Rhexocercosporidium sp. MPI-PUGE-AT-0058]|nr:fungal-specific transcription factor domain-containing protein [Rhexocercosporidium sp. MPI-PUGE-AT-0058]
MEPYSPQQDGESRRKRRRQSHSSTMATMAGASPQELGHMRPSISKGSSSFVGSGSGIYFVQTVQSAFTRNYRRESEAMDGALVPGEDDRLQTGSPSGCIWYPNEVIQLPDTHPSHAMTFEDLTCWSRQYWDNWHPPFPFLHAPSILGVLERASLEGIQTLSTVDSITVRSILSISVADRRQMPPTRGKLVPSNLVFNTVDDAISCLTPLLLQPSTLASLQALVAIQLFLVSMLRLNTASRVGGLITRIAFQLGLHRCPSRFRQFSIADADMRRRLFWAIYSLERYLSQSLGLPLDIKDDDVDVCYSDREIHLVDPRQSSNVQQPHDPRLLLLPAFLARHGYIKGLILELRHKSVLHRTTDQDEATHVDSEISKWWNEAQDLLDPHYMESEESTREPNSQRNVSSLKESHKLLLIVQKHESTILLNRPVITSAPNSSLFASAMQKCIGASKQIVAKVYQHLQAGMDEAGSRDGRVLNPLCWPGFTWCIWMSGLILVYAASEDHYSVQIAQKDAERCIKILDILAMRGSVWPGACASALRDLQKALISKSLNGSVSQPDQSPGISNPRSLERPSTSSNVIQGRERQERVASFQPPSTLRGNELVSPSVTNPEFRPTSSQRASQLTEAENGRGDQRLNTAVSQPAGTSFQADQFPDPSFFRMNGMFDVGEQFEGVGDIFQLMDASYQLGEQMFEPNLAGRY